MKTIRDEKAPASGPRRPAPKDAAPRPLDRDDALRRVRAARRFVQPRTERTGRFAHLTRVYD